MTTALIDADLIAYRCSSATEETTDWGDTGGKVTTSDTASAIDAAKRMVADWTTAAGCTDAILTFTGPNNFRKRILPTYKAKRGPKPEALPDVIAALEYEFISHRIAGLEADDLLGILATTARFIDNAVVVSFDKDLLGIPGLHFNPITTAVVEHGLLRADYHWLTQVLTGDPVDNYTGIPGVGPKGALKILGGPNSPGRLEKLWPLVLSAYKAKGLTEEDALVQARVARILRRSDYCKEEKQILLWHPTHPVPIPVELPQ